MLDNKHDKAFKEKRNKAIAQIKTFPIRSNISVKCRRILCVLSAKIYNFTSQKLASIF